MPSKWCSLGWEAWEGPAEPSAESRKPFADLRPKGEDPKAPLCFHLDDATLVHQGKPLPFDPRYKRMAILDARLPCATR